MSKAPILIGVDPGFASIGLARVALEWADGKLAPRLLDMALIETEKSDKKHAVYASDDNVRRMYEIYDALQLYFTHDDQRPAVIAAEAMSYPRQSSAAAKMSLAWGVLGAITRMGDIPLIQTSPQEVKQQVAGKRTATKVEVQEALMKHFPDSLPPLIGRIVRSKQEHPADALAVAIAAFASPLVRSVASATKVPPP